MQNVEIALNKLKTICLNFITNFERIMQYNRELTECLFLLYKETKSYKEFSESLTKIHIDNNLIFSSILKEIEAINQKTKEMPYYFYKIYPLIDKREEQRKIYDHYEKKLRKMEKVLKERLVRDSLRHHTSFMESFERNRSKFKNAKENYLNATRQAYDKIEELLDSRYDLINPVMINLHRVEMKIYESFINNFAAFKKLESELGKVKKSNFDCGNGDCNIHNEKKYDPLKFMKYPELDKKIFIVRKYSDNNREGDYGKDMKIGNNSVSQDKNIINTNNVNCSIDNSLSMHVKENYDTEIARYNPRQIDEFEEFDKIKNIYSNEHEEEAHIEMDESLNKIIHGDKRKSKSEVTIPTECIANKEHLNLNYNQRIIR
jgi:hypothetical protein